MQLILMQFPTKQAEGLCIPAGETEAQSREGVCQWQGPQACSFPPARAHSWEANPGVLTPAPITSPGDPRPHTGAAILSPSLPLLSPALPLSGLSGKQLTAPPSRYFLFILGAVSAVVIGWGLINLGNRPGRNNV